MTIGKEIRVFLAETGFTMANLATAAGQSRQLIWQLVHLESRDTSSRRAAKIREAMAMLRNATAEKK